MIYPMITTTIATTLVGLTALAYAVKSARVGYEDSEGFHEGIGTHRAFGFDSATVAGSSREARAVSASAVGSNDEHNEHVMGAHVIL